MRNGHKPERTIQTGIGDVKVKAPRVRDRQGEIKFSSSILPAYLRRTKSIEELLPWLYLKGLSTGDFSSALTALLGQVAAGLSAATISRLKEVWYARSKAARTIVSETRVDSAVATTGTGTETVWVWPR